MERKHVPGMLRMHIAGVVRKQPHFSRLSEKRFTRTRDGTEGNSKSLRRGNASRVREHA